MWRVITVILIVFFCFSPGRADDRGWAEEHHISRDPGVVWIENTGAGVAIRGSSDEGVGLQAVSEGDGFALRADGNTYFDGNVYIGSTSFDQRLVIDGNIMVSGEQPYISLVGREPDGGAVGIQESNGSLQFNTKEGVGRMSLTREGNLGIATTGPSEKLEVEGNVKAWEFITGDITFQKDGIKLWRMFEDEKGLYVENLKTGDTSKVYLEDDFNALKSEIDKLRKEIAALKRD
jgi:hypothetical protein